MRIGIPRETKEGELRVALTPAHVAILARDGHDVVVEAGAGKRIGFSDDAYRDAGARLEDCAAAWDVELGTKGKEIQGEDLPRVGAGRGVFGFQHLAAEAWPTRRLPHVGATP